MQRFEYRAVPAPRRGEKVKGIKSGDARFAHSLTAVFNAQAAEGWEFMRAETLPCDERKGLTGTVTRQYTLLVFRRALPGNGSAAEADSRHEPPPVSTEGYGLTGQPQAEAPAAGTPAARADAAAPDAGAQDKDAGQSPVLRADRSEMPQATRRLSLAGGATDTQRPSASDADQAPADGQAPDHEPSKDQRKEE